MKKKNQNSGYPAIPYLSMVYFEPTAMCRYPGFKTLGLNILELSDYLGLRIPN